MRTWMMSGMIISMLVAAGCGEPSREERVQDIAQVGCDRWQECGEIGPGERHESYAECRSSLESTFYDLWPAEQCEAGQMNDSTYNTCRERAQNFPCDSGILDQLSFANSCGAGDVCIDPRD